MAIRLVGFTAHEAGFIDNVLGTSLGGTFDNADVVDDDINGIDYSGGRAAFRWLPNDEWTVDVGVVYQKMKANAYSEDNVERSGRELAVVRFFDESRDDEWVQTSLTLQGDLGWGQFTSATSYFTRSIEYHQDNTDYTFYLTGLTGLGPYYAHYDLGPDPRGLGWSDSPDVRRVAQEFRLQGETDRMTWLAGPVLRARSRRLQLLHPRRRLRGYAGIRLLGHVLRRAAGHDRQLVLPYEERSDHGAIRGVRRTGLLAELTAGRSPPGLRWFDHTRHARVLHPAAERPLHGRARQGRENRPATSPRR